MNKIVAECRRLQELDDAVLADLQSLSKKNEFELRMHSLKKQRETLESKANFRMDIFRHAKERIKSGAVNMDMARRLEALLESKMLDWEEQLGGEAIQIKADLMSILHGINETSDDTVWQFRQDDDEPAQKAPGKTLELSKPDKSITFVILAKMNEISTLLRSNISCVLQKTGNIAKKTAKINVGNLKSGP